MPPSNPSQASPTVGRYETQTSPASPGGAFSVAGLRETKLAARRFRGGLAANAEASYSTEVPLLLGKPLSGKALILSPAPPGRQPGAVQPFLW